MKKVVLLTREKLNFLRNVKKYGKLTLLSGCGVIITLLIVQIIKNDTVFNNPDVGLLFGSILLILFSGMLAEFDSIGISFWIKVTRYTDKIKILKSGKLFGIIYALIPLILIGLVCTVQSYCQSIFIQTVIIIIGYSLTGVMTGLLLKAGNIADQKDL